MSHRLLLCLDDGSGFRSLNKIVQCEDRNRSPPPIAEILFPKFGKVLVANRGEIAVRIIRALRDMNIRSVAVFSDADRAALHVRMADEAEHIGPSPASESYLRIDRLLEAAKKHQARAIHPGYGFLSENADFAAACESAGMVFIGPSADSIRRLGSKTAARLVAKAADVPVVPGSEEPAAHIEQARKLARKLGYPVFVKSAAV